MKSLLPISAAFLGLLLTGCNTTESYSDYRDTANSSMRDPVREDSDPSRKSKVEEANQAFKEGGLPYSGAALTEEDSFVPSKLLKVVSPEYPESAKAVRLEGLVDLACVINVRGKVEEATVISSTDSIFEEPAIEAVKLWVFSPATLNGNPTKFVANIPVRFTLRREQTD